MTHNRPVETSHDYKGSRWHNRPVGTSHDYKGSRWHATDLWKHLTTIKAADDTTDLWKHLMTIKAADDTQQTWGAGIAQWLEHRTHDWKVTGSNPCWNGGRIFFSRVDFLCWLLFRYPFQPRVTTVARKKSQSFCQKCRWQVTAKHAYTLRMWILLNRALALVTTCP